MLGVESSAVYLSIALKFLQKESTWLSDANRVLTRTMAMMIGCHTCRGVPQHSLKGRTTRIRGDRSANFGPTSDAIGRANPGNQAREPTLPTRHQDPEASPGFVAPSQSQPTTPLLPDSTGQTPGR